jgi:hypothetical protein
VWAPETRKRRAAEQGSSMAYGRGARLSVTEPRVHRFVQPFAPLLLAQASIGAEVWSLLTPSVSCENSGSRHPIGALQSRTLSVPHRLHTCVENCLNRWLWTCHLSCRMIPLGAAYTDDVGHQDQTFGWFSRCLSA